MISRSLWLDKQCAVVNILCHRILCQSVYTCVHMWARAQACGGSRGLLVVSPKDCKELHIYLFKASK